MFTDRNTIVALEGTQGVSGMHRTVRAPGRSVHRIDVRTGKETGRTATPELSGLAGPGSGPGSVVGLHEREPLDTATVTDLVWLDRDGRETRRRPLNGTGWVDEPTVSPDANRLAYAVYGSGFPDKELRVVDLASGTVTDVPHPFGGSRSCGCAFTQVRWQAAGTLVAAPSYLDPPPQRQTGLRAFHRGRWHRVDGDPLLAAVKIRPFTQVLLIGPQHRAALYLLRTGPFGEPDDVYAEPASRDRPVAIRVSQIWVSPGGGAEPPFVLD